jgi:hypothetical protein
MIVSWEEFGRLLFIAFCTIITSFYSTSALEHVSPLFFQSLCAFSALFWSFGQILVLAFRGTFRSEASAFFASSRRDILAPLLSGLAFGTIPQLLLLHSFRHFPISKIYGLYSISLCVQIFDEVRMHVPFDSEALSELATFAVAIVFSFFPGFVLSGFQGGFLALFIPMLQVAAAGISVGISPFFPLSSPIAEFMFHFGNAFCSFFPTLVFDGLDEICEFVADINLQTLTIAMLTGVIVYGFCGSLKNELIAKHKSAVLHSIHLLQAIMAIPLGYCFFGEGDWHWFLYLALTLAGGGAFWLTMLLHLRMGFRARIVLKQNKDRTLYEYAGRQRT